MKLPFVSRERFDDERTRCEKLEAELAKTRAELIEALKPQKPVIPALPQLKEDTDLSTVQPIPGRPTIAMVTAAANKEGFKRAHTMGAKPISEEVAEIDQRHWRRASGD